MLLGCDPYKKQCLIEVPYLNSDVYKLFTKDTIPPVTPLDGFHLDINITYITIQCIMYI